MLRACLTSVALVVALACRAPLTPVPQAPQTVTIIDVPAFIRDAVDADGRSAKDRALDDGRRPAQTLTFFGIRPGMRVAELGAGSGYTTELLARTVGATGTVFAQNPQDLLEGFLETPWSERLAKPVMANVVRLDRDFDDPFSDDVANLDAVLNVLFYHDTVWLGVDRGRMNERVFAVLKRGGLYGVVDHSARVGDGATQARTLHRIEKRLVRAEIESAGFRLVAEADFLRNADDERDWSAEPSAAGERRGTSDRFVLLFMKP